MLLTMLFRSVMSYTIFLASRKIVKGSLGAAESVKFRLKLHRCLNCWRLFSGELAECDFCGSTVHPLYSVYSETYHSEYNDDPDKREGLEKQVYNDSRNLNFNSKGDSSYDGNAKFANRKSGRHNQRGNTKSSRYVSDNRKSGNRNSK